MTSKLDLLIKRKETIILTLIIFLGAFLRFYNIDKNSLWLDEIGQVIVATMNLQDLLVGVSTHLSPPLDYLIMHFFLKFTPHNDLFFRMPAAIFGIASILFVFLLGKQLFSIKVGLISALLFSISPFDIYYSQEARMYSSFLFFTLVSFYTFIRFIETRNKYFYPWIISGILMIYTHYFGFFILLIQFIFLLFKITKSSQFKIKNIDLLFVRKSIIGFTIIGFSFVFWLNVFLYQTFGGSRSLWYGIEGDWVEFFIAPWFNFSGIYLPQLKIATALFIALISIIAILYALKNYYESAVFLIIWILLPLIITYIITIISGPVTTRRNFIFILPATLFLLSIGILKISELIQPFFKKFILNINYTTVLVLLLVVVLTLPNVLGTYAKEKSDWRGVANYLMKNTKSEDNFIFLGGSPEFLDFYNKVNVTYLTPQTMEEFMDDTLNNKNSNFNCTWVFITGHSNAFWIVGQKNNTNKSMILETINNNYEKINGLYSTNDDETGLYKKCQR